MATNITNRKSSVQKTPTVCAVALGQNKRLRRRLDEVCRKTKKTGGIPFAKILAEVEKGACKIIPVLNRSSLCGQGG